ncbi:MFS transporter [Streptomyces lonarensis]|uniref:MFS transporter n=1 Tax=Streptomyces lonarensis TaxID=700599 RepID=A0A7X6CYL9_9ACTN|nr:MFS transporter [Streptomyces lonarensis]NJQ04793.1 MFS transporter [Streptomyces lonarensis]
MRAGYAVWLAALLAYVMAVFHRTSLGVAGLEAADQLGVGAGALSAFVLLQVVVYAAGQVPAGMAVDRWGARAALTTSGLLLFLGQGTLALSDSFALAAIARVLVGMGDALVFVSVLGLIPQWFPAARVPVLTQVTTFLGQTGQALSAVPFLALLHGIGWTRAFAVAAVASLLTGVFACAVVRRGPYAAVRAERTARPAPEPEPAGGRRRRPGRRPRPAREVALWRVPGIRLAFFGHMGTQFSMMVFSLLWGVPYLVGVHERSATTGALLITLIVVTALCLGPLVGMLAARFPARRDRIFLVVIAVTAATWTVVLAWPGAAPMWLLVVLVVVLGIGGPASVVAFDVARASLPPHRWGVAQGVANLGGYSATPAALAVMGVAMTLLGGLDNPAALRWAWLAQYPLWALAVVGILLAARDMRRETAAGAAPGVPPVAAGARRTASAPRSEGRSDVRTTSDSAPPLRSE